MGLFSRRKQKQLDTNTELLAKIDGRIIRYVTCRGIDENGNPIAEEETVSEAEAVSVEEAARAGKF